MGNPKNLKMQYKNRKDDLVIITIADRYATGDLHNRFNVLYTITDNGDGTQHVDFSFNALPAGTTDIRLGYSVPGANVWTDINPGAITSPQRITIPTADYDYRLIVNSADPQYIYVMHTPQLVNLRADGNPFELDVINNDEDKFAPVRAKQATFRFHSTPLFNLGSFAGDDVFDDKYYVTVEVNLAGRFIFKGYLLLDNLEEPHLSPSNIVTLKATDQLGVLKNKPLVNFDGKNPSGHKRIAEIVAMILRPTGLRLPINVISNLRDDKSFFSGMASFDAATNTILLPYNRDNFWRIGSTYNFKNSVNNNGNQPVTNVVHVVGVSTRITVVGPLINELNVAVIATNITNPGQWWDRVVLNMLLFEKEVGQCVDPYTALEMLLKEDAFITQEKGEWWVKRIDEYDYQPDYVVRFDENGNFIEEQPGIFYVKNIGKANSMRLVRKLTTDGLNRPNKFIKLTYRYNNPRELPCNVEFVRGDQIAVISPTEKRFTVECWTLKRGIPIIPAVPTSSMYIRRIYNADGYELERYLVLTPQVKAFWSPNNYVYAESEEIPMNVKDKFTVSVDWKIPAGITGFTNYYPLLRVILKGDDGSAWILGNKEFNPSTYNQDDYQWYNTANWTMNMSAGTQPINWTLLTNETEWQSLSWAAPPIPVGGKIYFWLHELNNTNQPADDKDIHYANLNFSYSPFIGGTYQKFTGHYNKVTQAGTYNAAVDEEVSIDNAPTRIAKGTLKVWNGIDYVPVGKMYNGSVEHAAVPADDHFHAFGYIRAFSVFNQYNRVTTTLRNTSILGLDSDVLDDYNRCDAAGLIHKYTFTDASRLTKDRWFMLVSFNQNWKTCEMKGTFREVLNTAKNKVYGDEFEFKLISD
jgi:hypothetical protein